MKIMFSIPVHEKPSVVFDQIINLKRFNSDCGIVLHISKNMTFDEAFPNFDSFVNGLNTIEKVYINPERRETKWGSIFITHYINFLFIKDLDFDFFVFLGSNQLFIKEGLYEFIKNHDFVGFLEKINRKKMRKCKLDPLYLDVENKCNKNVFFGYPECFAFKKELFLKIYLYFEKVNENISIYKLDYKYPREEILYPSLAICFAKNPLLLKNRLSCKLFKFFNLYFPICLLYKKKNNFFSIKRVDRNLNDYKRIKIRNNYKEFYLSFFPKNSAIEVEKDILFKSISLIHAVLLDAINCPINLAKFLLNKVRYWRR